MDNLLSELFSVQLQILSKLPWTFACQACAIPTGRPQEGKSLFWPLPCLAKQNNPRTRGLGLSLE